VGFDYASYELGKRSADRLVRSLRRVLCGDESKHCSELAELAPYLVGIEDCDELDEALNLYFSWDGLAWAYEPRGRPPSHKKMLVKRVLCQAKLPLDERFLEELSRPGGPEPAGEEEVEGW